MGSIGYSLFSEREASLGNFMCKSNSFAINLNTVWNENTKYTHCSRWIITKMIKCDITVSHIRIIYWISTTCHGRHFLNGRICKGTKFALWGAFLFFFCQKIKKYLQTMPDLANLWRRHIWYYQSIMWCFNRILHIPVT